MSKSETTSRPRFPEVTVELSGQDGIAFAVLGRVAQALRAGHGEEVDAFMAEATAGDYDAVLRTAMHWVDVS